MITSPDMRGRVFSRAVSPSATPSRSPFLDRYDDRLSIKPLSDALQITATSHRSNILQYDLKFFNRIVFRLDVANLCNSSYRINWYRAVVLYVLGNIKRKLAQLTWQVLPVLVQHMNSLYRIADGGTPKLKTFGLIVLER